ncbi:MAG: DinB family protein [Paenibacillaceae bacterium]
MDMNEYLFRQLEFVRNITLKAVEGITEDVADTIHPGFRNNIRWNLGHIYLVQERFAFQFLGMPLNLPANYSDLFAMGTSPLNWTDEPPALSDIINMLSEQQGRIRASLEFRLNERVEKPYTTSSGLTMETVKEFLTFAMYHEGMHFSCIKMYKALSAYSER